MGKRFAVQYGLTVGPAHDLTNGDVTYMTTDDREQAESIAAALNTLEGTRKLHAEIAAQPEHAGAEQIRTYPARVVELSD